MGCHAVSLKPALVPVRRPWTPFPPRSFAMSTPAELHQRPLVWITDDSPIERAFTQRSLGSDYTFETFEDGSLVIERLAAGGRQPDVLLLDWVMPAVSGDEVCKFLRSQA